MINPLRIARGIIGTALTWSIPWSVAGAVLRIVAPTEGGPFPTAAMLWWSAVALGTHGALIGALFALVLAIAGPRRFASLTVPFMALVGALVGLTLPAAAWGGFRFHVPSGLLTYFVGQTLVYAALSAAGAAGTLWLVRRSAVAQPELESLPESNLSALVNSPLGDRVTR